MNTITKSHIDEAIKALNRAKNSSIDEEINFLENLKESMPYGIIEAVVDSQYKMCDTMGIKFAESFENKPCFYFGFGLVGEVGELSQNILRTERRGGSKEDMKASVSSELDDVIIYSVLLALSYDIDLTKIVNDKCKIIIERAKAGYYNRVK